MEKPDNNNADDATPKYRKSGSGNGNDKDVVSTTVGDASKEDGVDSDSTTMKLHHQPKKQRVESTDDTMKTIDKGQTTKTDEASTEKKKKKEETTANHSDNDDDDDKEGEKKMPTTENDKATLDQNKTHSHDEEGEDDDDEEEDEDDSEDRECRVCITVENRSTSTIQVDDLQVRARGAPPPDIVRLLAAMGSTNPFERGGFGFKYIYENSKPIQPGETIQINKPTFTGDNFVLVSTQGNGSRGTGVVIEGGTGVNYGKTCMKTLGDIMKRGEHIVLVDDDDDDDCNGKTTSVDDTKKDEQEEAAGDAAAKSASGSL